VPEYDATGRETGRVVYTRDWMAAQYAYASAVRDWIIAASSCLEAQR
jgi:hypothetical protein